MILINLSSHWQGVDLVKSKHCVNLEKKASFPTKIGQQLAGLEFGLAQHWLPKNV